jgi:hypothetical protein
MSGSTSRKRRNSMKQRKRSNQARYFPKEGSNVARMPTTQKKKNQKNNVGVLPITRKLLESQMRKMSQIRKMAISQLKKKKKRKKIWRLSFQQTEALSIHSISKI